MTNRTLLSCRLLIEAVLFALVLPVALAKPLPKQWVGTWAAAPLVEHDGKHAEDALPSQSGATLREVVRVSLGGDTVRVRFSNLYGVTPLLIGAAEIAQAGQRERDCDRYGQAAHLPRPALRLDSSGCPGRQRSGCLFKLAPLSDATISFFLPHPSGPITEHQLGLATSFHAAGNVVSSAVLQNPGTVMHWEYLNGIDVLASCRCGRGDNAGRLHHGWCPIHPR